MRAPPSAPWEGIVLPIRLSAGLVLICLLLCLPVRAAVVPDLYTARVPVADRSEQALSSAAQDALAQVLVKVSGSAGVLRQPSVAQAMRGARSRVQTYAYLERPGSENPWARIEFDADYVTRLVRESGAPLWTANRPPVLGWVVLQQDNRQRFLSEETDAELIEAVKAAFSRRGLVLQLPLHDLKDSAALRPADAWSRDRARVAAASERYAVENIVIGRATAQRDGTLSVDWIYDFADDRLTAGRRTGPADAVFEAGADLVADSMASRYAITPASGELQPVRMLVSGVFEYADYAAVIRWVRSLEPIAAASVERVQGDRLTLLLSTRASASSLSNIVELNDKLVPEQSLDSGYALNYRWRN